MNAMGPGAHLGALHRNSVLVEKRPAENSPRRAYRITSSNIGAEVYPGEEKDDPVRVLGIFECQEYREGRGGAFYQADKPPLKDYFWFSGEVENGEVDPVNSSYGVKQVQSLDGKTMWLMA